MMCPPTYYGIYYEINAWMHKNHPADDTLAQQQWDNLYQTIVQLGVEVCLIEPVTGLPDMVFTANAGLIYQKEVYVSNFAHQERQSESEHFAQWFVNTGYQLANDTLEHWNKPPFFEGAGDALFLGNLLIAGYGFRSQIEVYNNPYFQKFSLLPCELINPYFYHLDTCFCSLTPELALWYPGAFSPTTQQQLQNVCELIAVDSNEAKHFACNAVVIDKNVIIPTECPILKAQLQQRGFQVFCSDMSEFIKAGGGCKCLTLAL